MSRALPLLLAALFATLAAGPAWAGATKHVTVISVAPDSSDRANCQKIVDSMSYHIRSRHRFELTDDPKAAVDHKISVSCVGSSVNLSWVSMTRSKKAKAGAKMSPLLVRRLKLRREGELANDFEALGLLAVKELLRELPWEGEVAASGNLGKRAKEQGELILGEPKAKYERQAVALSVGYLESEAIGNCVAFDLGTLLNDKGRPKFVKIGEGLIVDTRAFEVDGEAFVKAGSSDADKVFFRIQAPDAKGSQVKRYVRKCKERIGEGQGSLLTGSMNYPGLLSKESIELNMVRQRAGFYVGGYKTTNGLSVPLLAAGYVHNKLEIGDFIDVDGRIYRTLVASPYNGTDDKKSELTQAEGFVGGRYSLLEYTLAGGVGLMIDKANIPFDPIKLVDAVTGETEDDYKGVRSYKIRPAFYATALADYDDYWAGIRGAVSLSTISPYYQLNAEFNLRLTDTWFLGWDVLYESIGQTSLGEPGLKLFNFGGHLGFTIRRAKPPQTGRK